MRVGQRLALAGLLFVAISCTAWAATTHPGAVLYSSPDLQAGVLVDWALWEDPTEAAEGLAAIDALVETGRCRSVYMYVFSDGHMICPLDEVPLPNLGMAADTQALAAFTGGLHQRGVKVYALLDTLEWHRAGSTRQNPLEYAPPEWVEAPIGESPASKSSYASITQPRALDLVARIIDALAVPEVGFDGIILNTHLDPETLLGGSTAMRAAFMRDTRQDPSKVKVPPKDEQDLKWLDYYIRWRDNVFAARMGDLVRRTPMIETGLVGRSDWSSLRQVVQENELRNWTRWICELPFSVLLLEGDWAKEPYVRSLYKRREDNLRAGCGAVARPLLADDETLPEATRLLTSGIVPVDELVVTIKPGVKADALAAWAKSLPAKCPEPEILPTIREIVPEGSPKVSLSLADAEVLDALRDIGDALHATNQLGLAFDEPLITPWVAAKPKLTCSFSDADPAAVLTWLARTLNVSITLNGDRYVIHSLPDPARVHGDRLRGAQASDFPPYCRQAIEQYRAAVARGRDLLESYKAIGDIYRENAQWADGEKAYADFLALGVRDPYVLMEHGNCLRELGRYDDSFESLAEALEKEPADNAWLRSWIRVALGRTYIEVKRYAEAEKQIQEAVDILPNNGWAYYHLGDAYAKDGKVEEARGALGLGLSIAPWMAPARDLLNQLGG